LALIPTKDHDDFVKRYLLGDTSKEELKRWEERFFNDDEAFLQTVTAEYDLIDSYVSGELSLEERHRFKDRFLRTTEQRARVRLATVIRAELLNSKNPLAPTKRFATWYAGGLGAAAAMALVAGGLWLRAHRGELDANVERKVAVQQQPTVSKVGTGNEAPPTLLPTALFMTLSPGRVRSQGREQLLGIAPGVETVQLRLDLEHDEYPRYDAVLETAEGREIWRQTGLSSEKAAGSGKSVTLAAPVKIFEPGDYVIRLTGITASGRREVADDYTFRTLRQ
jgi:hypothetical protein